ncbi:hypothetical protein GCM10010421_12700 [Streptomyces glaucus]|uniref:Uncharacterized protein n=1 Tax=Streptomyces glaucus TaxID=284029 RepID=A0ABP5WJS8_9ACTN
MPVNTDGDALRGRCRVRPPLSNVSAPPRERPGGRDRGPEAPAAGTAARGGARGADREGPSAVTGGIREA